MSSSSAGSLQDLDMDKSESVQLLEDFDDVGALASLMGPAQGSNTSVIEEVKAASLQQFNRITDWLSQFLAGTLNITAAKAKEKLLSGTVEASQF